MQLLRKSINELKLLEVMSSTQAENLQNDDADEATGPTSSGRQQEVIEKVLKNVAVASEVP